ncbi:PKD domain-containing protein [Candidatus Pacearchaeota archaeon]|nr:PKD domain-containing protein [Candidatus Pacearchaeota archaeon]
MKRLIVFLLCFSFVPFVFASVEVHNYSVEDSYSPEEVVKGEINLTIMEEDYDEKIISNYGHEILFGDFLEINGVNFECNPPDCLKGYRYFGEDIQKEVEFSFFEEEGVGFVLEGGDIVLDSLNLSIESDFGKSWGVPLAIEFFEKEKWKFSQFSDSFAGKEWGCYNPLIGTEGALIGDSFYCEMIFIADSGSLQVGAKIGGHDSGEVNMVVYPESGTGASWECSFDPNNESEDGCILFPDAGEIFYKGNYQVCVGADSLTGYKIYDENEDENCGFVYGSGVGDSKKDYAIFVQVVKYADSNYLDWADFDHEAIIGAANEIIQDKYKGNCSKGCVLPMILSGVPQSVGISDVKLIYTDDLEWKSLDKIYNLDVVPASVDFSGILDLSLLGFVVGEAGEFIVSLGNETFFSKNFEILSAPIISSVLPLNPPFGVPISFYATVDFDENESLMYEWDFGDGEILKTDSPTVVYSYGLLGNYTLSLKVDAGGGLISEKDFEIKTVSPEVAITANLAFKKEALSNVERFIAELPIWYGKEISGILDVVNVASDLDRIDKDRNDSVKDEDLKKVAEELFALDSPVLVSVNSFSSPYLMTDFDDVRIEPIEIIAGGTSGGNNEDYVNSILIWQNQNTETSYFEKEFVVTYYSRRSAKILQVYDMDVVSKSNEESYFVINMPLNELFFRSDVGARKAGDSTVVILGAGEKKKLEFYYEGSEPTSFFISPKLSSLVLEADIDVSCNYNLVCEPELGENYKNCRSDCKPVSLAVSYLIFGFLFLLIVYTGLQIWYKKHYEGYLFKDAAQLYNLLMYVTNARVRGMKDSRIAAVLRSKGWSSERVNYVMKKSRGQRTGMLEVIPIERVAAYLRNRKAAKKEKARVATLAQQQGKDNINKS